MPVTAGGVKIKVEKPGVNVIDAAARGAYDGLHLALNIGAMLIAFIGLIALVNGILGAVHSTHAFHWMPGSMQAILGAHLRAHRVAARRQVERLRHGRQSSGHAADPE